MKVMKNEWISVTSCIPHYPEHLGGWTMNIIPSRIERASVLELFFLSIDIIRDVIKIKEAFEPKLIQEPSEW